MDIKIDEGVYVVAVSGGIDSMSLLHALSQLSGATSKFTFVVAHCDHGIRPDSQKDRRFVQEKAKAYGLPFVFGEYNLGVHASEATARRVRYTFLRQVQAAAHARAIITAHHQQDMLETAILNLMRGTGRKGLTSMHHTVDILRPFLHVSKRDIQAYAKQHSIDWVEDNTNQDMSYARNRVRHTILPRCTDDTIKELEGYTRALININQKIDAHLLTLLHVQSTHDQLYRQHVIQLPFNVSTELVAAWLRQHGCRNFDTKTLNRITIACRTAKADTTHLVKVGYKVYMTSKHHVVLLRS